MIKRALLTVALLLLVLCGGLAPARAQHVLVANVLVQCTAPGTAAFTGCAAVTGRDTFAIVPAGRLVQYFAIAVNPTTGAPTGAWESGWGAWSGTALTRNPYESTNADAVVDFTATAYLMLADQGGAYIKETRAASVNAAALDPFIGAAISTGTINASNITTAQNNHPGLVRFASSATANSGYRAQTDVLAYRLAAGDVFAATAYLDTLANTTLRVGYHDSITSADAVDGVYIEVTPTTGVASCKASANSVRTTSATTATLTAATWYRFVIVVESTTLARCIIVNDSSVDVLNTTVATNIPSTAGRETGAGLVVTNSGTVATSLLHLDYMMVGSLRKLVRARW
jgi:hypothetical protein